MNPFPRFFTSTFHVGRSTRRSKLKRRMMFNVLILFHFLLAGALTIQAQPPVGENPSDLIIVPASGKFLVWYGYAGRTYFVQVSDANNPLGKWNWVPIIEAGNNANISYEVDGTAAKNFFRLKPTDLPIPAGRTLDTADFDHDGISNIDEIDPPPPLIATDPLNGDTDGDGMNDGWERSFAAEILALGAPPGNWGANLAALQAGNLAPQAILQDGGMTILELYNASTSDDYRMLLNDLFIQAKRAEFRFGVGHTSTDYDDEDDDNFGWPTVNEGGGSFSDGSGFGGGTIECWSRTPTTTQHSLSVQLDPFSVTPLTTLAWFNNESSYATWTYYSPWEEHYKGGFNQFAPQPCTLLTLDEMGQYSGSYMLVNGGSSRYYQFQTISDQGDRIITMTNWAGRTEKSQFRLYRPRPTAAPVEQSFLKVTTEAALVVLGNDPNYVAKSAPTTTTMEVVTATIPAYGNTSPWIETTPAAAAQKHRSVSLLAVKVEITVAFGLGAEPVGEETSRQLLEDYLETIKVSRTGDIWIVKHTNAQGVDNFHGVEIVTTKEKLIDAMKRSGQTVVFDGHSNFGLGPNFSGKVTHKTIDDFVHFGVGKTSIPKSCRGAGTESDVIQFTNGDGTTLPTNPQDLAAIDRVYAEGWAYLKLEPGQIIEAPQNYQIAELGIERFENLQGVAPGSVFTKQGNGFNNEWHFDNPESSRRLIVQAPSSDIPTLGYAKFFYNACNTGRDYFESFKHGDFIYTKDSCKVEKATKIFVQGVVEEKTNAQIMTDLNKEGVGNGPNQSPQIYGYKTF